MVIALLTFLVLPCFEPAWAEDLKDNSFLIEEAFNQEAGKDQFIQLYRNNYRTHEAEYSFTTEVPIVTQNHQLGLALSSGSDGDHRQAIKDLLVSYRYQLARNDQLAMTPRISLVVPTGSVHEQSGHGAVGVEIAESLSLKLTPYLANHWNLSFRVTPRAESETGAHGDLREVKYGMSFVYLMKERLNFLVELYGETAEAFTSLDGKEYDPKFLVSPGVRGAFNWAKTQIVPGVGFPIGAGPSAGDVGMLFYLSVEPQLL